MALVSMHDKNSTNFDRYKKINAGIPPPKTDNQRQKRKEPGINLRCNNEDEACNLECY